MAGPFELEGYDVLAPLGESGRCWWAVCLADGQRVVLQRCVATAPFMAEVRRRAALWGSLSDGVVPIRDVVRLGADLVLVTEHAGGGGLDTLLARRPRLSAGQVVTLVVGVGETLAAAHERGLVHGRISPAAIVLDDDGRPLVTDHVFAGVADASADVAALAELALGVLDDDVPASLVTALRAAADPAMHLPATALVESVRTSAPAEPLLSPTAPNINTGPAPREPRPWRLVGAVVVLATVLGAVAVMRVTQTGSLVHHQALAPVPLDPVPITQAAAPDWRLAVQRLEARRLRALRSGDPRLLATAELRGTALWSRDIHVIAQVRKNGARVNASSGTVSRVTVVWAQTNRVRLRVVDALSTQPVALTLVRRDGAWLLRAVRRA